MRDPVTTGAATEDEEKFCMVNHLVLDMGLTPSALALYVIFLKYADNRSGQAFPSRGTMARMIGTGERTVDKYIKELEANGLVRSFPRWRNAEGKASAKRSEEFNARTSNGYVVTGHAGVRRICEAPLADLARHPSQDLRTNYTHNELDPSLTRESTPAKNTKGTRISEDWMPKPDTVEKIKASVPGVDLATEHEKFIDYFLSVSGEKGVKKDWDAAWRNWMRRAKQWSPSGQGSGESKSDYFKNMAASKVQQLAVGGRSELEGF